MGNKNLGWSDWLGIRPDLKRTETRWLGRILGQAILIVALAVVLMFVLIFGLIFHAIFSLDDGADVRNVGLVLAAIIGAPFVVWRAIVAQQQADTALQGLITDRISKAVEGLGAEKTLSRVGRPVTYGEGTFSSAMAKASGDQSDHKVIEWQGEPVIADAQNVFGNGGIKKRGDWRVFVETKPNLEVRIGAIYALERISQDSPRDHLQIMEILCAYVRGNSPATKKMPYYFLSSMHSVQPLTPQQLNEIISNEWHKIIGALNIPMRSPRKDIQVAITVMGRRSIRNKEIEAKKDAANTATKDRFRLDLREACLQGVDFTGLDFSYAYFTRSELEFANFRNAKLNRCRFFQSHLLGTNVEGADFSFANLNESSIGYSSNIHQCYLTGACTQRVDFSNSRISQDQINLLFGDRSTTIHRDRIRPDWPPDDHNWRSFEPLWRDFLAKRSGKT